MNEMYRETLADAPQWYVGAAIDFMYACDAIGVPYDAFSLVNRLAQIQGLFYRGSKGLLGARSRAGTWN